MPKPSPSRLKNADLLHAGGTARTLQARKQQLVRDAIWDAATDLFVKRGFDETTVDDIAEAAGISRRSFFRYFSSKSDLMAQGIVSYAATLTDAVDACPPGDSLAQIFRKTVMQVARQSAANPRTRTIMQIAAKYPTAREAQLSRMAELQDRVAEAFTRRGRQASAGDLTAGVLAGVTLAVLSVTFRSWFERGQQDISVAADEVFATLGRLVCEERAPGRRRAVRSGGTLRGRKS